MQRPTKNAEVLAYHKYKPTVKSLQKRYEDVIDRTGKSGAGNENDRKICHGFSPCM